MTLKFLCLFVISVVFCQCLQNNKQQCDYVGISRTLVKYIKDNDVVGVKRMMAFDDKEFWNEGGKWGTIKKRNAKDFGHYLKYKID